MSDYPGRFISATDPTVTSESASGVWTLEEAAKYKQAGTWPVQSYSDPNFNQTVLLLHGDGTNGAQNNTFLDGSTNNFTITRNGNTTQGTFSPFSLAAGEWSNYFDGTNDRLTIADNAALRPGTSNFTIEAWVYRAAAGAAHTIFAKGASTPTGFAFLITSSDTLRFTDTSTDITSTGTVAANTWVHVAAVREGTGSNQLKLYINGVQDGTGTSSTNFTQTEEARIGENRGATDDFNGYISNFRYVIGTALYTTGFTPSTSPLTTTSQGATSSQVELLTCQSNRFLDNSTNAFTVSPVNNVRVTPFSPFAPSAAYSASTNGGSGYFDGTGDYLTFTKNTNASSYTCECWFYASGNASLAHVLFGGNNTDTANAVQMRVENNGDIVVQLGTMSATTFAATAVAGQWHHLAFVRSGSSFAAFLNGSRVGTLTNSNALNVDRIGNIGTAAPAFGYIASARIVDSAVYDPSLTTLTVPTAPLTAISNTYLLCNFTNAGIFDNTGKNNLETVGNAQIDTTTKKYGTGSMEFDGTGDYLVTPTNVDFTIITADFTLEFWCNLPSYGGNQCFIEFHNTDQNRWNISAVSNINFYSVVSASGSQKITATAPTINVWNHVALVKSGSTFTLYVNGVSAGTSTTTSYHTGISKISVGATTESGGASFLTGYIDDIRITKGVARYTANFTPPTAAFLDQ